MELSKFTPIKTRVFCFILLVFILTFCDDNEPLIKKGKVAFSFSQASRPEGRISETSTPAFVVLNIEDTLGHIIESDKKMPLHAFGEHYTTDDLVLAQGNYQLTKFLVVDSANVAIYVTPIEGSDFSQMVSDPLPIRFSINENINTPITSQVLSVLTNDTPERFGYVGFSFEVVGRRPAASTVDLPVKILYAQMNRAEYDSVYVRFLTQDKVIIKQQRLRLDTTTQIASGIIADLPFGEYEILLTDFKTVDAYSKSELRTGSANIAITPSTHSLFSNGLTMSVSNDDSLLVEKSILWTNHFAFYLFDRDVLNAVVTLPVDPLNPYFEISLFNAAWNYFYADRSFYDERSGEPGSRYLQASSAFEKYNDMGRPTTHVDTSSFSKVTMLMKNKPWDLADCLVIYFVNGVEQPLVYYQWTDGNSINGRKRGNDFSVDQIIARKHINLSGNGSSIIGSGE